MGIDATYDHGLAFISAYSAIYWAAFNATSQQGELRGIDTLTGASKLPELFPGGV